MIANAPSGKYIVKISNIGSISQEREVLVADSEIRLGRIELADDSRLLQEVVVTGQRRMEHISCLQRYFQLQGITTK